MLSGYQNESGRSVPRPPYFRQLAVALGALLIAGACGPSVQSIYEGNVRFEHCYRLDLEVDTAPTHREACWKEWLGLYTYGQPRDRIEYARRRAQAFASGDVDRPSLQLGDSAKKPEARQFYLVVPSPTSVHAPPPSMATRWYEDAGTAPASSVERPQAPEDQCGTTCRENRSACTRPCETDAGKSDPSCMSCDQDYRKCMKRCFQ